VLRGTNPFLTGVFASGDPERRRHTATASPGGRRPPPPSGLLIARSSVGDVARRNWIAGVIVSWCRLVGTVKRVLRLVGKPDGAARQHRGRSCPDQCHGDRVRGQVQAADGDGRATKHRPSCGEVPLGTAYRLHDGAPSVCRFCWEVAHRGLLRAGDLHEHTDEEKDRLATAHTTVRYFWRLAHKKGDREVALGGTVEPATHPDLEIFGEEQQRVLRLFRGLPEGQRTVAALFYDGLSCEEIAELTGKPPATVRSQLRHARHALKEVITSEAL